MKTALVIDDNRQPADALCRMLTFFDLSARPAYGARAAILSLRERTPDIIFLDITMPGVDGYEVLAYLRREPRLGNIPVIVVTADDSPETDQRARQEGAIDVVIKPASLEAIEQAIKQARLVE